MSSLATIKLNDGNAIPWLAFGTGTALYQQDAAAQVRAAIEHGLTHLDGAQMYKNEDSMGDAASTFPRSSLYITTKLGGAPPAGSSIRDSLQESLKKLKVDYVDLFLIHTPQPFVGKLKEAWKEMEGLKKEGLAKSIGVSNFKVEHLKEVLEGASVVPAVNQIEYHPYLFKASQPLIQFHKEHGIVTESYGGLTPIVRVSNGPLDPVLKKISERLSNDAGKSVSLGQVLSKWLLQQDIVVVTTTSKPSRMKEFLAVPGLPNLTDVEIRDIEEAGSKLHKRVFMAQVFGD